HVELVTMPMPLEHFVAPINLLRQTAVLNFCRPGSQSHARAFVGHVALLIEQTNHRIGRSLIELSAVSVGDSANVAREFNCRHLHAEAKAEIGELIFPGETRGFDFSFHSAVANAAGNEY